MVLVQASKWGQRLSAIRAFCSALALLSLARLADRYCAFHSMVFHHIGSYLFEGWVGRWVCPQARDPLHLGVSKERLIWVGLSIFIRTLGSSRHW